MTTNPSSNSRLLTAAAQELQAALDKGQRVEGRLCPRCKGSGGCVDCQGSGRAPCPQCQGQGNLGNDSRGNPRPCKVCKGRGYLECSPQCDSCLGQGVITSALQSQILAKYAPPAAHGPRKAWGAGLLISICLGVYLLQHLFPFQFAFFIAPYLAPYAPDYASWQIWRLLSAAFLHANLLHLLCNLSCLYVLGQYLEGYLGGRRFLIIFVLGAVGGNILSVFLNPHPGIGASGGIYALLSAAYFYQIRWGLGEAEMARNFWQSGLAILGLGFLLSLMGYPYLDNWAHLGGAIAGAAWVWSTKRPF